MMSWTRLALSGAAVVMGIGTTGVALAQIPEAPDAPVPEDLPEEVEPVAETVAPTTNVVCRTVGSGPGTLTSALSLAGLASAIAGAYTPVPPPSVNPPQEVHDYVLLAQAPCAPLPTPQQASECQVDREIDAAFDEIYRTGAGFVTVFVPVPTVSTGPAMDTLVLAESQLSDAGAPIPETPAADAYDQLGCEDVLSQLPGGLTGDPGLPATPASASTPVASVPASPAPVAAPAGSVSPSTPALAADLPGPARGEEVAAPAPAAVTDVSAAADRWPLWRVLAIAAAALAVAAGYGWKATRSAAS